MAEQPVGSMLPLPLPEAVAPIAAAAVGASAPIAAVNSLPYTPHDVNASALGDLADADLEKLHALLTKIDISGTAGHAMAHITELARSEADTLLTRAGQVLAGEGARSIPNWQSRPEVLAAAAQNLFDAGGYANFVCSAYLTQAIVEAPSEKGRRQDRPRRVSVDSTWNSVRQRAKSGATALWWRAPLLVLLAGWLAVGLVAGPLTILVRDVAPGSGLLVLLDGFYRLWGLGFLALVAFGFWARVRKSRF